MENQYEIQAAQAAVSRKMRDDAIFTKKWNIKCYLCKGGDLGFKIFSPSGLAAQAFVFPDGRLSEYGKNANIEFLSETLKFSDRMVERLKKAGDDFIQNLPTKFPEEYQEMGPFSL